MSACEFGCTVFRHHLSECSGKDSSGNDCRGCAPRDAEVGRLCLWCFQRLTASVVDLPVLVRHLEFMAEPHLSSPLGRSESGRGSPGSRSLYPEPLAALDELVGVFTSWLELIEEEHPRGGITPLRRDGWQMTRSSVREAWTKDVVAVRPQVVRASIPAVDRMVKWLLPHLSWCAEQPWAVEMRRELVSMSATLLARWPLEERAHTVPMPCPSCGGKTLLYSPPADVDLPAIVACSASSCGAQWVEDSWTRLVEHVLRNPKITEEVSLGQIA